MKDEAAHWSPEPHIAWLLHEGHQLNDLDALVDRLAERLVDSGLPLVRFRVSLRILHPLIAGQTALWESGVTLESARTALHGMEQRQGYHGSPLEIVGRTRKMFRRRLEEGLEADDHSTLHSLAGQGASDYLALPMSFSSGRSAIIVAVTARAGGFTDADVAGLEKIAEVLCPVVETISAYRLARTLADSYIGPRSGRRVLEGQIRRGDVETLRAAIWFSDLRGWSRLSNSLPSSEAVALANEHFELVESAIGEAGGEILKLIGDAVLAIFPVEDDEAGACRAAVEAAMSAQRRAAESDGQLDFGVGLHVGELIYGNIGTPTRLDFTVMGQAVNLASRIEGLSKTLGQPVVLSETLASAAGIPCTDLGLHGVPGWDEPVWVFSPPET